MKGRPNVLSGLVLVLLHGDAELGFDVESLRGAELLSVQDTDVRASEASLVAPRAAVI